METETEIKEQQLTMNTRHSESAPESPEYLAGTGSALYLRYERTLALLEKTISPPARILDLGPANPLSERMEALGYEVVNTEGDLDEDCSSVSVDGFELVTAFEILEHLVGPLEVLRAVRAPRLLATVPLRLWFASAYRNPKDPWDRHYHEFEDWQFDWLLEKAGWSTVQTEHWTSPARITGLRPLLRRFVPRYYAVYAQRSGAL